MSSMIHIHGEFYPVRIECDDDSPCIWIRTRSDTVSIDLTRDQRALLRKAIDEADELDAPLPCIVEAVS